MKLSRKLLQFIVLSLVASIIVKNLIGVAIMEVIGKGMIVSSLKAHVAIGGDPDAFVMSWPWYYLLVNCFVFSIFWFFLGRIAYKKFEVPSWRFVLIVSVLYFFLSFDITFVLYLLVTLLGGFSIYAKSAPMKQAI